MMAKMVGRYRRSARTEPSTLTFHRSWHLFALLVFLRAACVLFMPGPLAPLIAGSVYLPLMPLQQMGIPVFSSRESGGWAAPSALGWASVISVTVHPRATSRMHAPTAACNASAICKNRGPPCTASCGDQVVDCTSCMVFNWDILSQCMELALK